MKRRRVEDLMAERDRIGKIIDDRIRNNLRVDSYTQDYGELTTEIDDLLKGDYE